MYQKFLAKYPKDPLVPDIKRNIKKLQKQLASGATTQTTGSTPTGSAPLPTG
jgi:hypothetical protein